MPVQFPLWVKCQIEHEEEEKEQQNLKTGACPDEMFPGSPTAYPSQMWCRRGERCCPLMTWTPYMFPMQITTELFANLSLVGFQPPSPMASWYYSVESISLMCLCWTHSSVFRINMIMIIRTGNSGTRQARASKLATEMPRLSGSALISGHLGHSHHLLSAGSNVPFCLLCSKSSRMAKLTSLALGLASFSQN